MQGLNIKGVEHNIRLAAALRNTYHDKIVDSSENRGLADTFAKIEAFNQAIKNAAVSPQLLADFNKYHRKTFIPYVVARKSGGWVLMKGVPKVAKFTAKTVKKIQVKQHGR